MPNFSPSALRRVEVDADDHVGADHARALDHVEADAAEPEHDDVGAGLDLGGVDHRADAGGHAAADVADLVERRVLADLGDRDLRQHGVVGEGRAAHVVVASARRSREAAGAVGHHALALGRADRRAEVGLARQAGFALPAFRRVERDDVVALLHRGHARPDLDHDAGALVAEDRPGRALRIGAGQRELVGVADPGRLDLDQHLAGFAMEVLRLTIHLLPLLLALSLAGSCAARTYAASGPEPLAVHGAADFALVDPATRFGQLMPARLIASGLHRV